MPLRKTAFLVVPLCLVAVAACGGKSAAAKDKAAAVQAKAACDVFVNFHPPTGSGVTSQIDAAKATYGAFLTAAQLSSQAAAQDSRWKPLASAAEREAAAFQIIVKATVGSTTVDRSAVGNAVNDTKAARPLFLAACAQADPGHFGSLVASSSPSASSTATS